MYQIILLLLLILLIITTILTLKDNYLKKKIINFFTLFTFFFKFLIIPIIFFFGIYASIIFYKITKNSGIDEASNFFLITSGQPFPIVMFSLFTFVYFLYEITSTSKKNLQFEEEKDSFNRAKWADKLVTRWENSSKKSEEISILYNNIMSKQNGNGFYTESEWKTKFGNKITYYDLKDQKFNSKLRFVCLFIQEMTNLYRVFNLGNIYVLNNEKHLEESIKYNYQSTYSTIVVFRLWLSDEFVRNVWENIKKTMNSPNFCAWVQYFIINPVENDKNFWIKYSENWREQENKLLNIST